MFDVIQIIFDLYFGIFDRGNIAIIDLGLAGQSRFGQQAGAVKRNLLLKGFH
jgi:hypothetical protein